MTPEVRLSAILLLLLPVLPGCAKPTLEDKLKTLQGEWTVVQINKGGKVIDDDALKTMSVTIQKDIYQLAQKPGKEANAQVFVEEFVLQTDPSKPTPEIDFVLINGDDKGKVRPGIYALEGDKLKLCVAETGKPRPTEFTATASPAVTLIILQRKN